MKTLVKRSLGDKPGSMAIEYALIGTVISVAIVAAVITIANVLSASYGLAGQIN